MAASYIVGFYEPRDRAADLIGVLHVGWRYARHVEQGRVYGKGLTIDEAETLSKLTVPNTSFQFLTSY